jgi:hypothetical protein
VRREIKGLAKLVDVRKLVLALALGDDAARTSLERAGLVGRIVPIDVSIAILQSGSAKIVEMVEALTGDAHFPHQALRVALLAGGATPFDLECHRKPPVEPKSVLADAPAP